jgi:NitT/TauT family transport system ATP-binding protein
MADRARVLTPLRGQVTPAGQARTSGRDPEFISLRLVGKHFSHSGTRIDALRDLSFEVGRGEFVSVIGPSGCGKSTMLRIVGGLVRQDSGSVSVAGLEPEAARAEKLFGFVPQAPALLPWRNVLDNVTLLTEVRGPRRDRARRQVAYAPAKDPAELLELVGLAPFAFSHPRELSGGMQQRVNLVRAFALGAPVLLMDEPFASLDENTRDRMRFLLLDLWQTSNATVIFVTHAIREAVMLSDRVLTFTGRPGTIASTETIELARPRREEMEESPEFLAHVTSIRRTLSATSGL